MLLSVVLVAAVAAGDRRSQVFMNDTGAPAYGLAVTFDQPVEIHSHGEEFADWVSLKEGTTVVFFGGEIPVWGTFYFFWSPAEAQVVDAKWLDEEGVESLVTASGAPEVEEPRLPSWLRVVEGVLFEDDFEGRSDRWALGAGWQIVREGSNSYLRGEGHTWATLSPADWSDYSVEFSFKLVGTEPFHFNFRCNHGGVFSRYLLGVGPNELYLHRQIADDFWGLMDRPVRLQRNRWHTLKVLLAGRTIKVYVNDRLYINFVDEQLPILSGGIAFETLGQDSRVYIDDISIVGKQLVQEVLWEKTGGPPGGLGYDVRISPADPNIMFVTDNPSGVNKSYDGGKTWVQRNEGILTRSGSSGDGIPIFCLTIDPNDPSIVWAGTQSARGIYKSTDGGETWTKMDNGITEGDEITFRGFAVRPGNSNVVFAAAEISTGILGKEFDKTRGKIYKTEDGGLNWRPVWEGDNLVRIIIFDPTDPDVMYASTGIFDREAYNTVGVGILKSTDGGETWREINNGITNRFIGFLDMHPTNPQILMAAAGNNAVGQHGAIYRTKDGGEMWETVLTGDVFTVVVFSPSDPEIVYAGSAQAFYRSEDGGNTWVKLYKPREQCWGPPGIRAGVPISAVVAPNDPMTIYVNNYGGGVFCSRDGGATWEDCSKGYTGADLNAISVVATQPDIVYVVGRSGPYRSLDGGASWEGLAYGPAAFAEWYAVAVNPRNPLEVLVADEHQGTILYSVDGGLNWVEIFRHPLVDADDPQRGRHGFRALAWAPSNPDVVYAGMCAQRRVIDGDFPMIDSYGMYKLIRQGYSVQVRPINRGLEDTSKNVLAIAVHPENPDIVYASIWGSGIYKTTDGGESWHPVNNGLMGLDVRSLTIDPANPEVVYAGLAEGVGIFKTVNGGELWEPANGGLVIECPSYLKRIGQVKPGISLVRPRRIPSPDYYSVPWSNVTSIVIDPTDPSVLYAADAAKGVYMSLDGGTTWYPINAGLTMRAVDALAISADGTVLYAATSGGGVFKLIVPKEGTASAGSEKSSVFMNDTGEPAYGLSVTFDRPVEVQELGEGFLEWTSLEDGTVVVFFGGEIPARGTFYFLWTPAEARVSKVRWLGRQEVEGLLTPRQRGDGLLEELCSLAWQPTGGPEGGNFTWVAIAPSNPKIVCAGTNRGYLFKTTDGGARWERLERFHSADPVFSIAVDPHNPDLVYVASCRIYRSCDGGATWSELDTPAQNVHHLAIHPSDPNVIYVGTHAPGSVYRSGDGGEHWRVVWRGPPGTNITALTLVNSQEVYVSAGAMAHSGGLYRSRNGGRTWEKVDIEGAEETLVHSIAVSPVDPRVIYVGLVDLFNRGCIFPVLKTVDEGKHWEVLYSFPSPDAHLVAVAPDGETVYVGSGGSLYRSEDGGKSWVKLRFTAAMGPGHVFDLSCIAIDPSDPAILFLPTSLGIFRSIDGGDTWDFCTTGMIASEISHVVVDPRNPDRIYATSILGAGTFRSDDRGKTWKRVDQNGIDHVWTDELTVDPTNPDVVYEIADVGKIFKTDNGGESWRLVNGGFRFSSIYALAVDPRDSDVVYAAKNGFGIFKSTDGGRSWTYLRGSPDYTYAIAISPSDPDILYAGYNCKPFEEAAAIYKSTDGGESWTRKELGLAHPSQSINDIVIDPTDPDVVYVAAMHNGILKTTDGGESWTPINVGLRSLDVLSLAIDPHDPEVLYAGLAEGVGVFKSTDGGETWEEANNGIYIECPSYLQRVGQVSLGMKLEKSPTFISGDYYSIPWTAFTSVAVSPSDPRIVYASDFHRGLYRSEDGGASWRLVNGAGQELEGIHIRDIAIDPHDPDLVYVCSDKGVFKTEDGGESWGEESQGLISRDIHTLAVARGDGRLYAGSKGYGVFRYEDRLRAWQQSSELGNFGVHWPVWDRVMYQYSAMLIDPHDPNTIYIGTFPAGIYKSTDGGRTWVDKNLTFTNDGIMFLIAHPEKKDVIYAGTYNGVSRSVDGGESWEVISEGIPPEQWVFSIAFDPTDPDIMYAATKNGSNQGRGEEGFHGTVLKSLDGGETWFEITNGLDKNNEFYAIVVHPRNPNVLFLATQGDGVYVSTDAGESWQPMNQGLPTLEVGHGLNVSSPLKLDAAGRSLYLATNGFGVFRLDLPTSLFQPAQAPLALPDLAVTKVDLVSEGLVAGGAVRLVATIVNRGNADVPCEVEVAFVLTGPMDSQIVLSTTVPGLGVGQGAVASVEWEPEAGEYTIAAEVDPAERVEEWNESNNRREGEQVLVPGRGSVCFHDDFERGAWGWPGVGLAWRIEREPDGNHVLRGGGSDGTYIGREGFYEDDVTVEMRFCLEEGDFLIYFRHCDEGAYVFHLHLNGIAIERFDWFDDREEIFKLGEASYPLGGVWHTLQIRGEGPELSLYIDGKLLWRGTDSGDPFLAGGLFLEVFPDTDVRIDDIRVIRLP